MSEPNAQAAVARQPDGPDRPRLGPGRRGDDERRLRGDRGDAPGDRRARRRGRVPVAALVLLRAADRRRGRRAGPGPARPAGVRSRRRGDRRRDHPADPGGPASTRRTTRAGGSTRSRSSARSATCSSRRSAGSGHPILPDQRRAVQPDRVRRRDVPLPGRGLPAHDRRLLVRQEAARARACASATSPFRRPCPTARRSASAIFVAQIASGYSFPNALLQHAIEDLERLSIDIGALERRRDRLVPALRALGYEATMPEGTFYVMARSPMADDEAFSRPPGQPRGARPAGHGRRGPGWFRISLTASEAMVERGLRSFASAIEAVPPA